MNLTSPVPTYKPLYILPYVSTRPYQSPQPPSHSPNRPHIRSGWLPRRAWPGLCHGALSGAR
eukprot:2908753-Pleurochrysis_carterae.AAC.1